jgi:hypothetical protein
MDSHVPKTENSMQVAGHWAGMQGLSGSALLNALNWSVALGLPATVVHVPTALLQEKQLFQLLCVTPRCFAAP